MPYIIQKKGELVIVPEASAFIYRGTHEECEDFLGIKPPNKDVARERQLRFLRDSNRGQGWRKGIKGVYKSQVK